MVWAGNFLNNRAAPHAIVRDTVTAVKYMVFNVHIYRCAVVLEFILKHSKERALLFDEFSKKLSYSTDGLADLDSKWHV